MKLYDVAQVARFLDLSPRRVRMLVNEGIIQEVYPGKFDLVETNRKYINFIRKGSGEDGKEVVNYNTERALLVRAKRRTEEYELRKKENTLHESEDVERIMTDMLVNFKSRLMSIPAKLSPILVKKTNRTEIFEIIKNHVDEALEELSDFNTLFREDGMGGMDSEEATDEETDQ